MVLHWTVYNDTIHNDHGILSLVYEKLEIKNRIWYYHFNYFFCTYSAKQIIIKYYTLQFWLDMTLDDKLSSAGHGVVLGVARKSSWHNHGMRLASMRLLIIVRNSDKLRQSE